MKVLAVLKSCYCGDVKLTRHDCLHDGVRFQIAQGQFPVIEIDVQQAIGLVSELSACLNGTKKDRDPEFVDCGPIAQNEEPAGDTVALLCAAARKWAKWDARWQELTLREVFSPRAAERFSMKREKWQLRTISYGHHLLAAGVADGQMESADLAVFRNSVVREFKRLDTLAENLRGRVSAVEFSIGTEKKHEG